MEKEKYSSHSGIIFSLNNEILPFVTTWMDLEGIILSEISQRKTNTIHYHFYVESKKKQLVNIYNKRLIERTI